MSFLTIDIETAAQRRFLDVARLRAGELVIKPEWLAVESNATPEALEYDVEHGIAPLEATGVAAALHATTCEVVQVSYGYRRDGNITVDICQIDQHAGDERSLLAEALGILGRATAKGTRLVSFNGKQFDIPVLRARAAILHMPVPDIPWRRLLYPYADDRHADLRLVLGADNRYAKGTLQWWAEAFGVHAEEHGAEVGAWVRAGEWDRLRAYGATEGKTLVEMFERVVGIL